MTPYIREHQINRVKSAPKAYATCSSNFIRYTRALEVGSRYWMVLGVETEFYVLLAQMYWSMRMCCTKYIADICSQGIWCEGEGVLWNMSAPIGWRDHRKPTAPTCIDWVAAAAVAEDVDVDADVDEPTWAATNKGAMSGKILWNSNIINVRRSDESFNKSLVIGAIAECNKCVRGIL